MSEAEAVSDILDTVWDTRDLVDLIERLEAELDATECDECGSPYDADEVCSSGHGPDDFHQSSDGEDIHARLTEARALEAECEDFPNYRYGVTVRPAARRRHRCDPRRLRVADGLHRLGSSGPGVADGLHVVRLRRRLVVGTMTRPIFPLWAALAVSALLALSVVTYRPEPTHGNTATIGSTPVHVHCPEDEIIRLTPAGPACQDGGQ